MPSADTVNSENFERILFSRVLLKDIHAFATVKKSRFWYDLPTLVNVRLVSPFCEGSIFTKLHIGIGEASRKYKDGHWILAALHFTCIDLTLEIQCCLGKHDLFGNNYHI